MLEFGTDGVRGRANSELSVEFALKLGQCVARAIKGSTFVIGRDTRVSGTMLQAAFAAGLASRGVSVLDLGVIPSPGVAFICTKLRLPGAVISASHNPYFDNGIKIIGSSGTKLSDETEAEIERLLEVIDDDLPENVGTISDASHLVHDYVGFLADLEIVGSLQGLTLVIDVGHGAASTLARSVFESYGSNVIVINDSPDGTNINAKAGSTHLDGLRNVVISESADLGLAFDGDADRVLAVDDTGEILDGDFVMAILARFLKQKNALRHNCVAVTVMSNMGFGIAMAEMGISVIETDVGDRYVFDAMERHDLVLGGEQSGHVIMRDIATTGDGMLTGLVLASAIRAAGIPTSTLATQAMTRFPQVLENIGYGGDARARLGDHEINAFIEAQKAILGNEGRILVRASGTEPVIRVMVEAKTEETARSVADDIARVIKG